MNIAIISLLRPMKNEIDFILTPMETILEESAMATATVETGIESFPLCDFVMQTTFLRMTGFQEQKMKCICWELASNDYKYRYDRFKQSPLGEGSSYKDKKIVFDDLLKQIKRFDASFADLTDAEKESIFSESKEAIEQFYQNSGMKGWAQKAYQDYRHLIENWDKNCIVFSKSGKLDEILNHCENCARKCHADDYTTCKIGKLREVFDKMIEHRNRCAHNTLSYQRNLPSCDTMLHPSYAFENYFLRFIILLFFDKIYILLFKKYLELSDSGFEL